MTDKENVTKVLIFIPWFYPAFRAGGPVRSIVNLVNYHQKNIIYYIICGNTDLNETPLDVKVGEWMLYNHCTSVWYADNSKRSDKLVELSSEIKPDVILIVGLYSWHFTIVPLLFCKAPKKIISARGMLHPGAMSQKRLKKRMWFAMWKILGLHHKATFHATDQFEKEVINEYFGEELPISIAGNFPNLLNQTSFPEKQQGCLILISLALISPMKNHLMILESLQQCTATIIYHIYGPIKDEAYWNECKERIVKLPINIKVQYHGEANPQELDKIFSLSHVFILPSKSENFGHAFLEAMSSGRPIITSHYTPWNNLTNKFAGINVELTSESILSAIHTFAYMDNTEFLKWSMGASQYAQNEIAFDSIHEQYSDMFKLKN